MLYCVFWFCSDDGLLNSVITLVTRCYIMERERGGGGGGAGVVCFI